MKIDNFILLIISIITLIIITLLTECNKERLLELEQNSIKKIIETFYHFDIKNKNSSGEWGYKITGITPGQYGGRSIQDVQAYLQYNGGHNINSYISNTEKDTYDTNLFDYNISGSQADCETTGYGSCIWSDASGNVISSSDSSGAWRKKITSISHNVDPNNCGAVGSFVECSSDESGVLEPSHCDNNPIKNTCGNCGSDGKLRYSYSSNPRRQNAYGGTQCDNLNNIMNNYIYIHQYCINPKYESVIETDYSKEIINYEFILHSDSISRQRPKNSITGRKPPVWNKHNRDMKIDINLGIDKNFCLKEFILIENMDISFNYQINGTDDDIIPYNTNIIKNIINNRNVTTNNDYDAINNTDYEIKKLTYFPNNSTIHSNYRNKIESFEIEIPINDDAIKKKLFIHLNTEKLYNQWIMDVGGIDGVMFGNNKTPIRNLTDYWTTGVDFTNDRALNHIKQKMPGVFNNEQERLHWENMKRSGVSEHGHNKRGYNDQLNTIFHLNKNIEVVFFKDSHFKGQRSYPNRWNTEVLNNNRREILNYQNVINLSTITGIDPINDLIQSRENQQLRDVIRRQISSDWHSDVSSYICEYIGDSFMKWLNKIPDTYYNKLNTLSIKIKTNTDGDKLLKIDKIKLFNSKKPIDSSTVEYGTKEYQIMGGIMGGVSGTNNIIATVAGNSNHHTIANNLFNNISYGTDGWSQGWHTEWGGTDTRIRPTVVDGSPAILKIEFTKKRKLSKFILLPSHVRYKMGNLPSNIKVYGTNTPFDTTFSLPNKSVLLKNITYQWSSFTDNTQRKYNDYIHIMHGGHFTVRKFNPSSQDIIDQSQRIILIIPPSSQGYYKNYFILMDDKIMAKPKSTNTQNPIIIQELFVFEKGIELPTIV